MPGPGNPAKLKPFTKGDPRINRKGPPRKINLEELFANLPPTDFQKIVDKLSAKAKSGDVRAIELFLNRNFGLLKQAIEISNITVICPDDEPDLPAT